MMVRADRSFLPAALVGAVLAFGPAAPVDGSTGQLAANVEWRHNRLSVDADGAPFRELLAAIASTAGAEVRGLANLDGNASIHIANVTLRECLEQLLTQINYAIIEEPSADGGEGHIVVIVVGHKSGSDSEMYAGHGRGESRQGSISVMENLPDTYQAVERLAERGDVTALREAAASGDPTTRALAMQRLARQDPVEGRRVAVDAAMSKEPTQRVLAVQVLGGLDTPDAANALGVALMDSDAEVRRAAVIALMGHRSPAANLFLVRALQDDAESIRALALKLLARRDFAGPSTGIR